MTIEPQRKRAVSAGIGSVLSLLSLPLWAVDVAAESCEALRVKIGVVPVADPAFLRSLAARQECRFTPAEIYRAAYGDRPLPPPEPRSHRPRHHHHDDD